MHTSGVIDQTRSAPLESAVDTTAGRISGGIAFDDEGSGEPVVLLHAGVADRRMWAPLVPALRGGHRVIRPDARGFGETLPPLGPWSHHTDLLALLDELLITRAHLVGASMGAGVAVEAALARPEAVASLVLAAPGGALFGDAPAELAPIWSAEVEALDRGDLDAAVEVNLRAWVDGPSRPPEAVDPEIRAFVGRMQREAFELPEWDSESAPEHELSPSAAGRLRELRCPILVIVGEADHPSVISTAERIAAEAPDARLVVWPGVAHMLTLEQPDVFADAVLAFLAEVEAPPRPLRYVALGDSYTIGTATHASSERWPDQLVAALGKGPPALELVANLGVNGYTSRDVIEAELPELDRLRPGFVSLLVGVNDVVQGVPPETFEANAATILDGLLRGLPPRRIVVVATPDYTVTPQGASYGDPATQSAAIRRNNAILRGLAAERGIVFVDTFDISLAAGLDRSLVADDGLHPSAAQYALWVERVAPVVEELLRRR
jgi:3-oxoadipate enol-lactonase